MTQDERALAELLARLAYEQWKRRTMPQQHPAPPVVPERRPAA